LISSSLDAYYRICRTLEKIHKQSLKIDTVLISNLEDPPSLPAGNLIILGQGSTSTFIRGFCQLLDIRCQEENSGCVGYFNSDTREAFGSDPEDPNRDICIVSRVADKDKLVVILNSNGFLGLHGGASFSTESSDDIMKVTELIGKNLDGRPDIVNILLEVTSQSNPRNTQLEFKRGILFPSDDSKVTLVDKRSISDNKQSHSINSAFNAAKSNCRKTA
jgi:hypothetical protein